MNTVDEKEDGEISLEDVSSSDEGESNYMVPWSHSTMSPTRRSHSLRDAGYGKENRHYPRELNSRYLPNPASKADGLLPISSDDEHEIVELPDASHHLCIHLGKKKHKKRKKKKSSGGGGMLLEDFVSGTAPDPLMLNAPVAPTEITVHRRRRSPSPRAPRRHSPVPRGRALSRSPPDTPPRVYRLAFRGESPSPRQYYSRSPSPRRRSPRRIRLPGRDDSPRRCRQPSRSRSPRSLSPASRPRSPRKSCCHHPATTYADLYASSLLKKVRLLEGVGTITPDRKPKDHSSLKEKLNNILKTKPDTNEPDPQPKESVSSQSATEEEDENLDVLRRLALETKQPKLETPEPDHLSDNDPEDLELRMIALKSAVIKKHQKRVKNGQTKRSNPREMSPFVDSFLNDLEPGEPSSSPEGPRGQQVEDMELDTDVEREKESYSPYSPTDEIVRNSPEVHHYRKVSSDVKPMVSKNEEEKDSGDGVNMEAPYSPTDPTKTPWVDRFKKERRKNILRMITINSDSESSEAAPYSPSDTPLYDPELPYCPPELLGPQNDDSCVVLDLSMKDPPKKDENSQKIEDSSGRPAVPPPEAVGDGPEAPDDPTPHAPAPAPDVASKEGNEQTDPEPLSRQLLRLVKPISPENSSRAAEAPGEPLYLRGLPEVTKEPNKIPILVNKSLVPVSILKTNKNLQQPLPQKRLEVASEPAFKSAEMLPVDVGTDPVATPVFKPIKLQPVAKKPTVVAPAAAFNNVSMDESNVEGSEGTIKVASAKDDGERKMDEEKIPEVVKKKVNDGKTPEVAKKKRKRGKPRAGRKRNRGGEGRRKRLREMARNAALSADSEANSSLPHDESNAADVSRASESSSTSQRGESTSSRSKSSEREENEANSSGSRREASAEENKGEQRVQETSEEDVNDRKRRNSIEEDEETLRAILLASLAKRPKSGESRGSDEAQRGPEGAAKAQRSCEVSAKVQDVVKVVERGKDDDKLVNKTVKASEVGGKSLKPTSGDPPVNAVGSKPFGGAGSTAGAVQRASGNGLQAPGGLQASVIAAVEAKKRANPTVIRGPPKKIVKKAAIPVSTKVVNNAKKFQNTMMQRKMILQAQGKGTTSAGGGSGGSQNIKLVNVKANETHRPASPMVKASGKVQSLVIKLGEDSDSDSGEEGGQWALGRGGQRDVLAIPTTDFEKSVDQFLKEQRKKQETMALGSAPATSTPTSAAKGTGAAKGNAGLSGTPLAVRHLPPSQQEEYKRLKQKILEKERQRATRQIINTPPSPLSPASPISKPNKSLTPKLPSALSKPSNPPDPKAPTKAPIIPKPPGPKSTTMDQNSSQKSPQPMLIPTKTGVTDQFIINSSPASSQPMANLSIQIPNDNVTPGGRIVFNKPENLDDNSSKVPSALRILTTDQLNSKFVQVQLRQGGRTVTLGDGGHEKSIGELLQCSDVDVNCDSVENNESSGGNNRGSRGLGAIASGTDTSNVDQTSQETLGGDSGSVTVDSEASTVILPPREGESSDGEVSRESGDSTVVLDDTVEERTVGAQRSPCRAKSKSPTKEHTEKIKSDVKAVLEGLAALSEEQQRERLKEIEQNLVTKRYSVLDDLTEMSSTLKQWDIERELQTNLFAELRRLRAQLAVAKERLLEQRAKIDNIGPKVTNAHKMIVEGRTECLKLTKLCQGIGTKVVGQQYKVPVTGAQLMMERLKEVAYHTRQLSRKKVPCENNNNSNETGSVSEGQLSKERTLSGDSEGSWDQSSGSGDNVNSGAEQSDNATGVVISRSTEESQSDALTQSGPLPGDSTLEISGENPGLLTTVETSCPGGSIERLSQLANSYESVLTNVRTPRHIDCNRELCPFELTGVCKDDGCLYNHLEPRNQPQTIL
ncbi:serine/arginine repetitive matrix protein 2 [Diachasma alloeum]|uniref:serine/arginine repetitive matrix protein 2 n=1 Tax=Diachasma alloeum TaxID=454923 RepID=UPI0007381D36|nr:serine/arginine repetitive matrix protein 2 [Diachasma alloeum]XP_015114715.1 serine/arginine repetitive matrix protein 2 [Diachasma alloeum]XP_015114716.1 serine/arginine repetitive matrix protein 2 [Diachasma alloeum]XP_015114717.1 serine/arginine repetitive matrix protein 2 [Diachasma alloeum]XP_015114718.1 serine/arginine repetitive matrix protein 2 [Diachasma alloeum]